jgi:hypothetical protein
MANDWILDVLADLKTYARKNGLSALAEQLEETTLLAATEIASAEGKAPLAAMQNAGTTGYVY